MIADACRHRIGRLGGICRAAKDPILKGSGTAIVAPAFTLTTLPHPDNYNGSNLPILLSYPKGHWPAPRPDDPLEPCCRALR